MKKFYKFILFSFSLITLSILTLVKNSLVNAGRSTGIYIGNLDYTEDSFNQKKQE